MIRQITAYPLDTHIPDTVGMKHTLGGLCTGDPTAGILVRILFECAVDPEAGPERKENTGQNQNNVGQIKAVI